MTTAAQRPTVWTWLTLGWAVLVSMGVGYFLVRSPFQVSDNIGNLIKLTENSLGVLIRSELGGGPYMRPGLWAIFKIVFDVSGGAYHQAYMGVHAAQVLVLALLFARLLFVRTRTEFLLVPFAFVVLLGMHTFGGFVLEAYPVNTFTTIAICVLGALNLAESRGGWWADVTAVALLILATFTIELGLLVWVALAAAYLAGARGVSGRAVLVATILVAAYLVLRLVLVDDGTPALSERSSGFGYSVLDPPDLEARFSASPRMFYIYNVAASLMSVLFAEPRAGVFEYTREYLKPDNPLPPWMTINVVTSTVTSLLIIGYTLRRLLRWIRLDVKPRERLVFVFWGIALANAVISYPYTKDQIIAVAGCAYALAGFVVVRDVLETRWSRRAVGATLVTVVLLVVSVGWTVRAAGLHYNLTLAAFRHRNDWTALSEWSDGAKLASGSSQRALVDRLERESVAMPVPHPYLVYERWGSRYFDQH